MEVGTEISQKIRSAIKAKLLELGSYVDDELPDYIMVMVANKKSRSQMNGDLGLFLGTNTDAFTEWLHSLLEKLQTITVGSDKYSGKAEKPKPSKSKKKEKDKTLKADLPGKKSNKDRDKNKTECVINVINNVTDGKTELVSVEENKSDSHSTEDYQQRYLGIEIKKSTDLSAGILIEEPANEKHIIEDFEDVRQLLVTEAAQDELAEELETTEVEVVNLQTQKDRPTAKLQEVFSKDIGTHSNTTRSLSPDIHSMQESSVPRKRKVPTSVVATVSQRIGNDEEYDPHNPSFGSVASVVKVTARKSSIPPLLQANRLLLLKAMQEAENSVAAKKRVVFTKRASRENSPAEVYSPPRKRSDLSRDQASPPPYIPSKKELINRHCSSQDSGLRVLTHNDARHMLSRDSNRELVTKSRLEKILGTVTSELQQPRRREVSRSPDKNRKPKESEKSKVEGRSDNSSREVRSDKYSGNEKNFQITCHLSSDTGLTVSHNVDSRKRPHSPSPEPKQNLKVTISSNAVPDSKNVAARLGKLVVERKGSEDGIRENSSTRGLSVTSSAQKDARETIQTRIGHSVTRTSQKDARETINMRESHPVTNTSRRDARETTNMSESHSVTSTTQKDARDTISARDGHLVTSSAQRNARNDIVTKVSKTKSKLIQKSGNSRVISTSGKQAFQKQCEAAVISVQAAEMSNRAKRNMSPDSRVVKCDTHAAEEEVVQNTLKKSKEAENSSLKTTPSTEDDDVRVRSRSRDESVRVKGGSHDESDDNVKVRCGSHDESGDDDDDLSKMIDEDLGPELLDNTNGDDFSLDLDIDEDLSRAVGVTEDEASGTDILKLEKDEKRLGTKFIVTLDGIDERQFRYEDSSSIFDKFKPPPVRTDPAVIKPAAFNSELLHNTSSFPMEQSVTSEPLQQNHSLYLDLLDAQNRSLSLAPLQTSILTVPSKLTPPKIQPFSISLKDSDDEHDEKHDDKDSKSSPIQEYYAQTQGEATGNKRAKVAERCKFWPACAAGGACEYHHPTTHCKTFPNCSFGDKCLFIHPNCRFDSKCARPDCPYTHTSRRPALTSSTRVMALPPSHFAFSAIPPRPKVVPYASASTVCHYFPNCHNMNCRFLHPKPCKFGTVCKTTACPFYHPQMPGKDKLKWQANTGQLKADIAIISTPAVKVEQTTNKLSPTGPSSSAAVSSTSQ